MDANNLKAELGPGFVPLRFDVTDVEAALGIASEVEDAVGAAGLVGLVNNAGIALAGPLMHQPLNEVRRHFEVNVLGLISVTQAFLPLLGAKERPAHQPGRIVNIGSVSGRVAEPFIGAYAGTKHAVEAISDSLRRELMPYGIDVIVVRPGAVKTPIWEKGAASAIGGRYLQTDYSAPLERFRDFAGKLVDAGDPPEKVGRFIREVFETRRPRTKYALVSGRLMDWTIPTVLPDRWLDRLVGRSLGLTRKVNHRRRR